MEKSNKKLNWAIALSVISTLTVVTMIAIWICESRKICVVELDSFVGVIVALLAIIVTFVLGWQIFNLFELKQKLEEMNDLKSKFDEQSETIKKLSLRVEHVMNLTWGDNEMSNKDYCFATFYYIISLKYALAIDFTNNIPKIQSVLKLCKDEMNKAKKKCQISSSMIQKLECADKEIRGFTAYRCMKDFYDDIYKNFIEHTITYDNQK